MLIKGHPQNDDDFLVRRMDETARRAVEVEFTPIADSPAAELAANFDLVLGLTPEDPESDEFRGRRRRRTR